MDKKGRARPKQKSIVLGYKAKDDLPNKTAALKKWDAMRDSILNPAASVNQPREWTFTDFVNERYLPERIELRSWRPATVDKFKAFMSKMGPVLGSRLLTQITTAEMQKLLNRIAKTDCQDTVKGIRTQLGAIFREAREEGTVDRDPTRKLVIPDARAPARPFATVEQIRQLESELEGRDRTLLQLFTRSGLRAGEVFGLQPADVGEDQTIFVRRTFSKGRIGPPKTKDSTQRIPVPEALYRDLHRLCEIAQATRCQWVFPSTRRGTDGVLNPTSLTTG